MFASFLWMLAVVTVCRAGATLGDRLEAFQLGADGERRREELDYVHNMAVQAGFRYKKCISEAPIPGHSRTMAMLWAPAIMGELLNFKVDATARRRWGFHKTNFVTNVVDKLTLECTTVREECNTVATQVYGEPLITDTARLAQKYSLSPDTMRHFIHCAGAEIVNICIDLETQLC